MYLPYLRGKQYELIAIRELLEEGILSNRVIPLIEPVTLSPTLISTLKLFIDKKYNIALIKNPLVGSFLDDFEEETKVKYLEDYNSIITNKYIIESYICLPSINYQDSETKAKLNNSISIIEHPDTIEPIIDSGVDIKYYVIPDKADFRRKIRRNRILINDNFIKEERNADYDGEDFFSTDHLYYMEEGYEGFSDYSIVGKDYSESGFAPYAVAIHIVYFDEKNNLDIIHFVSESNNGPTNPAQKYNEALRKLNIWYEEQVDLKGQDYVEKHINSVALKEFIYHFKTGNYSGLGVIKKLSLKHHLELISRFLDGGLDG